MYKISYFGVWIWNEFWLNWVYVRLMLFLNENKLDHIEKTIRLTTFNFSKVLKNVIIHSERVSKSSLTFALSQGQIFQLLFPTIFARYMYSDKIKKNVQIIWIKCHICKRKWDYGHVNENEEYFMNTKLSHVTNVRWKKTRWRSTFSVEFSFFLSHFSHFLS